MIALVWECGRAFVREMAKVLEDSGEIVLPDVHFEAHETLVSFHVPRRSGGFGKVAEHSIG
jgi:hypothetical protein